MAKQTEESNEDEKTDLKEPYSNDSDHRNEYEDNNCSLTGKTEMGNFFNDIHAKRNREKSDANCTTTSSINDWLDLNYMYIYLEKIVVGYNEFSKKVCPIEEKKLNTNAMDMMDTNTTGHTSSQGLPFQTTSNDEKSQNSKPNLLQTTTRSCRYLSFMRQFSNNFFTCFINKFAFKKRKKKVMKSKFKIEKSSTCHSTLSSRTCSVPVKLRTEHEKEPIDIHQDENKIRGKNGNQLNIPCGKASKPAQLQRNRKIRRRPKRYTHSFGLHSKTNLLFVTTLMMTLGKTQGCKMKKTISTTDDTISMEVCYNHGSSKCQGNERWDLSDPEGLKNLFLNMAVSKGAERYSLESHDNCSKLSLTNVTEKDIYRSTFSFSKGTSGKIDIHLNQDPILDGKEQCFLECSGNNEFLILKMAVKHGSPNVFFNLLIEEMVRNLTANTRTRKKDLLYESDIEYKLPFSYRNFTSSLLKVLFVNGNTQLCVLEKELMVQGCEKKELEDSSEKQWGLLFLLALPIAIMIILFVLCIYKKKLLCFKTEHNNQESQNVPLNQVDDSGSPNRYFCSKSY